MMRVGLYRPVHVKTLRSQKLRMLLTHRSRIPPGLRSAIPMVIAYSTIVGSLSQAARLTLSASNWIALGTSNWAPDEVPGGAG